jgi:hypothetical protein
MIKCEKDGKPVYKKLPPEFPAIFNERGETNTFFEKILNLEFK